MTVKHKPFRALHTTRLAIRNDVVRAIRVTDRNFEAVAAWSGGEWRVSLDENGNVTNRRVIVKTPYGKIVARVGDFVLRNDEVKGKKMRNNHIGKSRWFVGKDDIFEAQFDQVK